MYKSLGNPPWEHILLASTKYGWHHPLFTTVQYKQTHIYIRLCTSKRKMCTFDLKWVFCHNTSFVARCIVTDWIYHGKTVQLVQKKMNLFQLYFSKNNHRKVYLIRNRINIVIIFCHDMSLLIPSSILWVLSWLKKKALLCSSSLSKIQMVLLIKQGGLSIISEVIEQNNNLCVGGEVNMFNLNTAMVWQWIISIIHCQRIFLHQGDLLQELIQKIWMHMWGLGA